MSDRPQIPKYACKASENKAVLSQQAFLFVQNILATYQPITTLKINLEKY